MKFDFDKPIDRRNTNSLKWNVGDGELPMWVADMDFSAPHEVRKAIERRAAHGVFGYAEPPADWARSYVDWWRTRHGYTMDEDSLIFCTGIVPAISSIVRKLTTPGEKVVVQSPVYNVFYNSIVNNGREVLESPLDYSDGEYRLDMSALEKRLADPQASLFILCNPHNPVGKIWDRQTLATIGELCKKHGVTVISDEIHCDMTAPGKSYVPFASVSDTCRAISATCISASKTFNIAGLQSAAVSVSDPVLRHKIWRGINTDEVGEPNVFGAEAAVAAFRYGGEWLDALREYIFDNKRTAEELLADTDVHIVPSEATYLLWADCGAVTDDTDRFADYIRKETGLYISAGAQFGGNGKRFVRINVACPRSVVRDGMERFKRGIKLFKDNCGRTK